MTNPAPPSSAKRTPEGVVVRVRARGGAGDYPVVVASGLLDRIADLVSSHAAAHRYAVVSDDTVSSLYGRPVADALQDAGIPTGLYAFPAGEPHKTRGQWERLTDLLLEDGFGRDAAVVAVGGGVTGDLAGFVAATFMRGVPVVQVPTTVVAMVDASVGGKTGVDTTAGKNLVGAFHPPRLVAVDPRTLATLAREERARGLAEAVKHGAILDAGYLARLEERMHALLQGDPEAVEEAVTRSVELKGWVVSRDEREAGLREILNFGHTVGHALEAASGYELSHGSAVAAGMVVEARIGEEMGVTSPGAAARLARIVERMELPARPPPGLDAGAVRRLTRADKKVRRGRPRYVLLSEIGRVSGAEGSWSREVPEEVLERVLASAFGQG